MIFVVFKCFFFSLLFLCGWSYLFDVLEKNYYKFVVLGKYMLILMFLVSCDVDDIYKIIVRVKICMFFFEGNKMYYEYMKFCFWLYLFYYFLE